MTHTASPSAQPNLFDTHSHTIPPSELKSIVGVQIGGVFALGETFDEAVEAVKEKSEAIQRVADHTQDEWKRVALQKLEHLCSIMPELTVDDLREEMKILPEPREPRVYGYVMTEGAKNDWCIPTERTRKSERKACHRRPQMVWSSLLFPSRNP